VNSDFDGKYQIKVASDATLVLVFYWLPLKKVLKVKWKAKINAKLEENSEELNEVVVIGYGTQKERCF
jgi:uncharacterized protein YhdP